MGGFWLEEGWGGETQQRDTGGGGEGEEGRREGF